MSNRPLSSIRPTEPVELESGLTLSPRLKLLLTVHRSDKTSSAIDDWKLKNSLISYLKTSHSITVPEEDLEIRKFKDLKKRKREDPVARGSLCVRDLGFLSKKLRDKDDELTECERKFSEWRRGLVAEMNGMELSIEGTKFNLTVELPASDDFEAMKKDWEEISAFGNRAYRRHQPDTIVLRGLPSRWFAETRVSSKPSMLVTHTIFSVLGKIRNLDVAEDNGTGQDENGDGGDIVSGLQCRIVIRFETHKDFCDALKILCGRSIQKQGSRLKADYEVTWDKERFFRNVGDQRDDKWTPAKGHERSEVSRWQPRNYDDVRRRRFKE